MEIISCKIKRQFISESTTYYVIENILNGEEHTIDFIHSSVLKNLNKETYYNFYVEYNQKAKKNFISLIHPEYEIGTFHIFKIIEKEYLRGAYFFKLYSDHFPNLNVNVLQWQDDFTSVKCKVKGYRDGIPQLENVDTKTLDWSIGDHKLFKVAGFSHYEKKDGKTVNTVVVEVDSENTVEVNAGKWHFKDTWKFKDLQCEIIGLTFAGLPKLIISDCRHPIYEIGKTYQFIITKFKQKVGLHNKEFTVIELSDHTIVQYEVLAIPNQDIRLNIGDEILCEVVGITHNLQLKQKNLDDPFYYDFEDVLNDNSLKEKYFTAYLTSDNEHNYKLKTQYEQRSAFWVFTYCNHILPRIKSDYAKRKDLKGVLFVNNLHSKFEEWILNNGIIRSFNNEEERKATKLKIKEILFFNKCERKALEALISLKDEEFIMKQSKNTNYIEIYYFLRHSNFAILNPVKFYNLLVDIYKTKIAIEVVKYHFIKKIIQLISFLTGANRSVFQADYFILSKNIDCNQEREISNYLIWLYNIFLLNRLIGQTEQSNLILSKLYRYNTLLVKDSSINRILLLNSFYIVSNVETEFLPNIKIAQNLVEIDISQLQKNPNNQSSFNLRETVFSIKIMEKQSRGFLVKYNELTGFLPIQNVSDEALKYSKQEQFDWTTNVEITLFSKEFNYFIAKQLPIDSKFYFSENNINIIKAKSGDIIFGTVEGTIDYGVFINTKYGDGLVHISQIVDSYLDKNLIPIIFRKGMRLPFVVIEHKEKLNLSFSKLKGSKYDTIYYDTINYFEIYQSDFSSKEDYDVSFSTELEKGYIFESYALIQNVVTEKIKYIKFAKIFFSNTFNARSFLLNIYLEYFSALSKLDTLLRDYSFEKYSFFRNDINLIRDKVQKKTLEEFPESKNLLFFIDILSLFNSKNEKDLETLFKLTQTPIQENDYVLKTVAKNALANNLIISEINYLDELSALDDFTFKNLKRIREYISQGVLSIKETEEDRLSKELNEKKKYWSAKILHDEGEKIEFKATLFTPIPNNDKKRIIESLQVELNKNVSKETNEIILRKIKEIEDEAKNIKGIDKIIIHSALKTICAFANTNGGELLIGVSDDKKIFGLEQDYNSFNLGNSRDEFGKKFDSLLKDYFGDSFSSSLLEKEFLNFDEGDILVVKVLKSQEEIFMLKNEKAEKEECLYVRNLSSSVKLKGIELAKFIKNKMKQQIIENS